MTGIPALEPPGTRLRRLPAACSAVLLLLLVGCVSGGGRATVGVAADEAAFLLPPVRGWPGSLTPERSLALADLHRDLLERDDRLGVLNQALEMQRADPGFYPAIVLEAQVRYLSERYSMVVDRLEPVRERVPGYVAAELLWARAAERLDRVVEAYDTYWSLRERDSSAAKRVETLREEALEEASRRVEARLADGLAEEAAVLAERMRIWAPADPRTVAAGQRLASATADPLGRLELLRRLSAEPDVDDELLRRRAELELEVGDPAAALRISEALAERHPGDPGLVELEQRAQFQWRLGVLPQEVSRLARDAQLTRAEYAVLLYWLFPDVRYGRPTEARIATDVIDHPWREPIVRVINLGLLDVDPTVHRFEPDAAIGGGDALAALLRLLESSPAGSCLESGAATGSGSVSAAEGLCARARSCGLLAEREACAAGEAISGPVALEWMRRSLAEMGSGT